MARARRVLSPPTSNIQPPTSNLQLTHIDDAGRPRMVDISAKADTARRAVAAARRLHIPATVRTTGKTGVEMEALTAAAVAALTVYDMCKAVDRGMRIEGLRLRRKSGGKSGDIVLDEAAGRH